MSDVLKKLVWMDLASCKDIGSAAFISKDDETRKMAMGVCNSCPVIQECLADAMVQKNTVGKTVCGVWGGVDFGK